MMTVQEFQTGLHEVEALDVEATRRRAEQAGYTTFVLPSSVLDRVSFFDAIRATFPLDPPVLGSDVWDALSDSLWEGLYEHTAQRIVILWPHASAMAKASPFDFEMALDVLGSVAKLLADPKATCDKPKEVAVIVD